MLRAVAELFSALILLIDLVETFWSDHQEQEELSECPRDNLVYHTLLQPTLVLSELL